MRMRTTAVVSAAIGILCLSGGLASASTVNVGYDPTNPDSGFGSPGDGSNQVAYTITLSEDATNLYGTIAANPSAGGTYNPGLLFSNLYFGVGSSATAHSTLGIEITNDDAFLPGGSGSESLAGTGFSYTANAATGVITFTLPWSFLETDPLGIGFDKITAANPDVYVRLSQSFGYSVEGGTNNFGPDDLGHEVAPVPLPPSVLLMTSGALVFGLGRWRRRRVA